MKRRRRNLGLDDREFETLQVGNHVIDIKTDAPFDDTRLSWELCRQPGLYAYYAAVAEEAYRRWKMARMAANERREDLDAKARVELGPRATESAIKTAVARDSLLRTLWKKQINREHDKRLMELYVRIIDQRGKLLQSAGAKMRSEQSQPEHMYEQEYDN